MFIHNIDENLQLRQLASQDARELYNLIESCRDYLKQWLTRIDSLTTVEATEYFINQANEGASAYNSLQLGIWFRGELAGLIGFEKIDWFNQWAEMGCWLGERFQGNGIMTRSAVAVMDYAFEQLGFHRIEMRCGTGNVKSRAIPEKLGFRNEGTIREVEWLHGRFIDHIIYGMTSEEYRNLKEKMNARNK